jgi:hypothetical protein
MHPELLSSLATGRRRDLDAAITARPVVTSPVVASPVVASPVRAVLPVRAAWRRHRLTLPRFRVSWTRTTLAAVAGSRRRGSSVVIVISATRAEGAAPAPAGATGAGDRRALVKAL